MFEILGLLAPIFAAVVLRTDRRIARSLRDEGALSAQSAFPFDPQNGLVRWRFRRLANAGAVRPAEEGRWYLDEAGFAAYRSRRRRRLLKVIAIVVPVILLLTYLDWSR